MPKSCLKVALVFSSEFCEVFQNTFFSENTSSGYFWHLHQSRFPILILFVIQWNLWIADTYGSENNCPLLRGVRYCEVILKRLLHLGLNVFPAVKRLVCGWFEKMWRMCLFEESHCSPALLKEPVNSTKLVAIIFVWKVLIVKCSKALATIPF